MQRVKSRCCLHDNADYRLTRLTADVSRLEGVVLLRPGKRSAADGLGSDRDRDRTPNQGWVGLLLTIEGNTYIVLPLTELNAYVVRLGGSVPVFGRSSVATSIRPRTPMTPQPRGRS